MEDRRKGKRGSDQPPDGEIDKTVSYTVPEKVEKGSPFEFEGRSGIEDAHKKSEEDKRSEC